MKRKREDDEEKRESIKKIKTSCKSLYHPFRSFVNLKLLGWMEEKEMDNACVCTSLCLRAKKIPKDMRMLLIRYVRSGVSLARKLIGILEKDFESAYLLEYNLDVLHEMCLAMYKVPTDEYEHLNVGKLLQYAVPEDEMSPEALQSPKDQDDFIKCLKVARYLKKTGSFPRTKDGTLLLQIWANLDPDVKGIPCYRSYEQEAVLRGSSISMMKKLYSLPGWDKFLCLYVCAQMANTTMATFLIEKGADVNRIHIDDRLTPLQAACVNGHRDMAELLLNNGANIDERNPGGSSALMISSSLGNVDVVRLLLHHNADVNIADVCGTTALIEASYFGHEEIVRILIEHGADLNVIGRFGRTALDSALQRGYSGVVEILEQHIK